MAVAPVTAIPIPNPTIPCSHNGVLKTLSFPKNKEKEKEKKDHLNMTNKSNIMHNITEKSIY